MIHNLTGGTEWSLTDKRREIKLRNSRSSEGRKDSDSNCGFTGKLKLIILGLMTCVVFSKYKHGNQLVILRHQL